MLGREVRLPSEVLFSPSSRGELVPSRGEYVDRLRERLQCAHDVARKHLRAAAQRQKQGYDVRVHHKPFEPGDVVWLETDISQLMITPKLRNPYEGPYVVLERIGKLDYSIQRASDGPRRVVHYNRLKRYVGDQKLSWARKTIRELQRVNRGGQ